MPIDPSQVLWDDEQRPVPTVRRPVPAGGIDPDAVVWDDEPGLEIDIVGGVPESQVAAAAPGGGLLRDLGMSARSVIQGAGSLVGAVGGDAFNHYLVDPVRRAFHSPTLGDLITGEGFQASPSYRDAAAGLADRLGLPAPQTSRERVLGDIGEALTGTGLTMGAGGALNAGRSAVSAATPTMRGALGDFLAGQPVLQTVSAATGAGAAGAARESGAGAGGQLAAALAGGLGPAILTAGVPMALRAAGRGGEQNRLNLNQAIQDFEELGGATPTVGQGTGSWLRQGVETLLAGGPTSGGVMARAAERQGEQIGTGLDTLARSMSRNPTAEGAGRSIKQGVDEFSSAVRSRRRELYSRLDDHVPPDATVPLARTQQALSDLTTPTAGAEATTGALVNPMLKGLADNIAQDLAAGQGGLPYEAVKAVRSRIGDEAFSFSLAPDRPTAQLRQVYAALTKDMEDLARQAGPQAEQAVRRANAYYKASQGRLETLERIVDKNGGPERVFQAAMAGTREGATVLRSVMRSLPKESQRDVTAAVIRRMGLASPSAQDAAGDAFSAATFLTNWNKLSGEARATLFNRFGPEMSENISKIARVADRIKDGQGILRSTSGTGPNVAAAGYYGSLGATMLTGNIPVFAQLATAGGSANVLARVLTNPRAVRWLARSTELPVGALPAQLNVLKRMAAENNDEDVGALADALEQASSEAKDSE